LAKESHVHDSGEIKNTSNINQDMETCQLLLRDEKWKDVIELVSTLLKNVKSDSLITVETNVNFDEQKHNENLILSQILQFRLHYMLMKAYLGLQDIHNVSSYRVVYFL
jgi:hypothetical protein